MKKEYLILLHNTDSIASGLLGSFDKNDKYVIDDKIKDELIKSKKQINDFDGTQLNASAKVKDSVFSFRIFVQDGEENKKRAGMFLIERTKLGLVEKEIPTLLKVAVFDSNSNLVETLKTEFNLFSVDDSIGLDMSNLDLKAILEKIAKSIADYKYFVESTLDLDRIYVLKMMKAINSFGTYGKKLLVEYQKQLKSKNINKNDVKYWHSARLILDKLLIENDKLFSNEQSLKLDTLQENYVKGVASIKAPVIIEKLNSKPKSDKKSDGKDGDKKSKSKGKGKDKKGGGKKSDKKSDNKGGDKKESSKKDEKSKKSSSSKKPVVKTQAKYKPTQNAEKEDSPYFIDLLGGELFAANDTVNLEEENNIEEVVEEVEIKENKTKIVEEDKETTIIERDILLKKEDEIIKIEETEVKEVNNNTVTNISNKTIQVENNDLKNSKTILQQEESKTIIEELERGL